MDFLRINDDQARALLERYWACETTVDEERALRQYFADSDEIPDDLRPHRPLFAFFASEKTLASERSLPALPPASSSGVFSLRRGFWMSAAAGVALLIGTFFWLYRAEPAPQTPASVKTVAGLNADQQAVFSQTKAALMLVSTKLQKGKRKLASPK